MKKFLIFLLVCVCIALVIGVIVIMVDTYPIIFVELGVWKYLAIIIVVGIITASIRTVILAKAKKLSLGEEKRYKEAKEYDAQQIMEYNNKIKNTIKNKAETLHSEKIKSNEYIQNLEEQIAECNKRILSNSVVHNDYKNYTKIQRLINYMEHGKADSLKEALLLDDKFLTEQSEQRRREAREFVEAEERERFRQEQQRILNKIAEEQKQYTEDQKQYIEDQKRYNEEQKRYNEEKIRLEKRQKEIVEDYIREQKYNK